MEHRRRVDRHREVDGVARHAPGDELLGRVPRRRAGVPCIAGRELRRGARRGPGRSIGPSGRHHGDGRRSREGHVPGAACWMPVRRHAMGNRPHRSVGSPGQFGLARGSRESGSLARVSGAYGVARARGWTRNAGRSYQRSGQADSPLASHSTARMNVRRSKQRSSHSNSAVCSRPTAGMNAGRSKSSRGGGFAIREHLNGELNAGRSYWRSEQVVSAR
jgi:hypothetical protein